MIKNRSQTKRNGKTVAKKKFGQNFLKDETVLHSIIESMPKDNLPVVEIGPGLGDLTRYLVEIKDVTAYEVDRDLCGHLRRRFERALHEKSGEGRLVLHCTDVLRQWDQASLADRPYHLVANLPYYIATNIILRALKDPNCRSLLVMVQKEVAEKFAAHPGQKDFSALSVLLRQSAQAHICFDVPPEAFVPAPKVVSSVLKIVKNETFDEPGFEAFLKTAFTQPRKTLAKNLSAGFEKKAVMEALVALGIDASSRPHQVAASVYHHLYKILKGDMDGREEKPRNTRQQSKQQQ